MKSTRRAVSSLRREICSSIPRSIHDLDPDSSLFASTICAAQRWPKHSSTLVDSFLLSPTQPRSPIAYITSTSSLQPIASSNATMSSTSSTIAGPSQSKVEINSRGIPHAPFIVGLTPLHAVLSALPAYTAFALQTSAYLLPVTVQCARILGRARRRSRTDTQKVSRDHVQVQVHGAQHRTATSRT